jgi:hypothetical protein
MASSTGERPDRLRRTLARNASYRRPVRQNCSEAALKRLSVPIIATSGSSLAVRGNAVRAARAERVREDLGDGEAPPVADVCPDADARAIAGIDGVVIESDDEATVPSCAVPLGAAGVGAALALTSVSCPLEPTRDSAVFVCSVVVVCASVVNTGWPAPVAKRRACSFGKMNS